MDGKDAIHRELVKQLALGKDWIIVDAVTETNLYDIVEAASPFEQVLWVGSAGLAEQIPAVFQWVEEGKPVSVTCDSVVVVAGSVSELTHMQIQAYVKKTAAASFIIDSMAAVLTPSAEAERILFQVKEQWKRQAVVISCCSDRSVVERVLEAGNHGGMTADEVGSRIASVLGMVTANWLSKGLMAFF